MKLYRCVAYRLVRANTPAAQQWPDMTVFFEAATRAEALATPQPVLACLWHCRPMDVETYNLADEDELLGAGSYGPADMGDAALLCNGWHHGPLFCRADRTLMLVSPPTLARLTAARAAARPFWLQQRAQAQLLDAAASADQASRVRTLRERMEGAHATGFGSL